MLGSIPPAATQTVGSQVDVLHQIHPELAAWTRARLNSLKIAVQFPPAATQTAGSQVGVLTTQEFRVRLPLQLDRAWAIGRLDSKRSVSSSYPPSRLEQHQHHYTGIWMVALALNIVCHSGTHNAQHSLQ